MRAVRIVRHGVENRVDLRGRQVLVINVVDHHHRRAAACREALFLDLDVELAVRRRLPGLDAEPLLDVRENVVAAAQHAGDVRAHRDAVPADGLRLEHRIERSDLEHLDRRQVQILGDGRHDLGRQIPLILVLRRMQRGDDGRALPVGRELRDPAVDLLAHVRGQLDRLRRQLAPAVLDRGRAARGARIVPRRADRRRAGAAAFLAHRSISPNTMSCVPMTATTSASMWPTTISFSAARCGKPAARTFTRYGLFAPSDTRYTPNSPFGCSTAAYASPSGTL